MGGYVGIPMSYTPVEYIQSSGTQWIDTGVLVDYFTTTIIDFQYVTLTSTNGWIAATFNGGNRYYVFQLQNSGTQWRSAQANNSNIFLESSNTNRHTIIYNDANHRVLFDGVNKGTLGSWSATGVSPSLSLLSVAGSECAIARIYSCQIKKTDGTLLRDLIPVVRDDGTVCMWDKVEEKAYYNAGAGTFTAGNATGDPDIVDIPRARKIIKGYVGEKKLLYTPVEYIESSGTQYIDTGFKMSNTTKIETKLSMADTNVMTAVGVGGSYQSFSIQSYNGNYRIRWRSGTTSNIQVDSSVLIGTTPHIFEANSTNAKIDGTVIGNTNAYTFTETSNLFIFAMSSNNTAINNAIGRIYYYKIYNGSTLVRDFIPVVDENNVACLYEKVEEKFYYNKGTGSFAYCTTGTPVYLENVARKIKKGYVGIPMSYMPVEYIESTGTQYIDTGFKANSNTKVEIKLSFSSNNRRECLFCGRDFDSTNTGINNFTVFKFANSLYRMDYSSIGTNFSHSVSASTPYIYIMDKNNLYENNTLIRTEATAIFTTINTMLLMASRNGDNTVSNYALGKLYYCKIWNGDTLVRELIPVLDDNEVACLYDLVEGKFYYNKGTGTFTAGSTTGQPVMVGSRAKLCYYCASTRKIPSVPDLSVARFYMGFAWTGKYAVFAGGTTHASSSGTHKNTVDAYDSLNFTRSTATAIYTAANRLGSAHIGDYAIFAGGTNYNYGQNQVNAYSSTLVRTSPTALSFTATQSGGATVSDTYALITGGNTNVNAYNASLTRTNLGAVVTNKERWNMMTPVGNYVVMPGGYAYPSGGTNTVEVINSSLVKSTATNLANSYGQGAVATSNSKFAIVAQNSNVEAFDENLVKYSSSLSTSRNALGGAGNEGVALIAGGNSSNVVDVFDTSLVRSSADPLTTSRGNLCGTVVNNYAFFAGGGSNNSPLANADAYELS